MPAVDNVRQFPAAGDLGVTVIDDKPLIEPGEYWFRFLGHETVYQFKTAKLAMRFKVVSPGRAFETVLVRYYNVKSVVGKGRRKNGRFTVGPCSDFYREYCAVFGPSARIDRVSTARYRNCIVVGEVGTVTKGHSQLEIPEAARYSVIKRLVRLEAGDQ